jgi:multiple sugar transport system permease protein
MIKMDENQDIDKLAAQGKGTAEEDHSWFNLSNATMRQLKRIPAYLFCILVCVVFIYPFIFMIATSFRETSQLFIAPADLIPAKPTLANYSRVVSDTLMLRWLGNSLFVAGATAATKVVIDSMAGYAFARLEFRFKNIIFMAMVGAMMVPVAVTMVPRFLFLRDIGLLNTRWGLILPYLSYPLGIFLMRQAMSAVPIELEDAARLDGCTIVGIYWRIVLPLVLPSLAVVAITTFMAQWVDLLWPVVSITSEDLRTVTVGIASMRPEQARAEWGLIMASNVIGFLPIVVLFIFLQRYFMAGLTSGSLK